VPFLLVAVAFGRTMGAFRWLRDRYETLRVVSGALLVAVGLAVFFDRLTWMSGQADAALRALGSRSTPATPVGGEVVVEFDRRSLGHPLGPSGDQGTSGRASPSRRA
jgi:hypothetical protein